LASHYARRKQEAEARIAEELDKILKERSAKYSKKEQKKNQIAGLIGRYGLNAYCESYYRSPETFWVRGHNETSLTNNLIRHLFCEHDVPLFLFKCWTGHNGILRESDKKYRNWFVCVARGGSLYREYARQAGMTRAETHDFLTGSNSGYTIEQNIWRAKIKLAGVSPGTLAHFIETRAVDRMVINDFWMSVVRVFKGSSISRAEFGQLMDFIVYEHGANRSFSMKGRTVESLLELSRQWHECAARRVDAASYAEWGQVIGDNVLEKILRSSETGNVFKEYWHFSELLNSDDLTDEGEAMRHCVARYAGHCKNGTSSIFSVRISDDRNADRVKRLLTIEINPQTREVIQVKGVCNGRPEPAARLMVSEWAQMNNIFYRENVW
jgi:hypothetical protein